MEAIRRRRDAQVDCRTRETCQLAPLIEIPDEKFLVLGARDGVMAVGQECHTAHPTVNLESNRLEIRISNKIPERQRRVATPRQDPVAPR